MVVGHEQGLRRRLTPSAIERKSAHLVLTPLELIDRIVAMVLRPRKHRPATAACHADDRVTLIPAFELP